MRSAKPAEVLDVASRRPEVRRTDQPDVLERDATRRIEGQLRQLAGDQPSTAVRDDVQRDLLVAERRERGDETGGVLLGRLGEGEVVVAEDAAPRSAR